MDSPITLEQGKYSKDGPFNDPVVRCDSCQKLLLRKDMHEFGICTCGNRRVRNVMTLDESRGEITQCKEWGIDPDFMALFEEVKRG